MYVEIDNKEILVNSFSIQMNIFGGGCIYLDIDNKHLKFIKKLYIFNILSDNFIARDSKIKNIDIKKYLKLTIEVNDISFKALDIREYKIGKILHKSDKLI